MATEKRLIYADALRVYRVHNAYADHPLDVAYRKDIEAAPTVDAVEVVRCKDCKHCCLDLSGRENHLCMRKEVGFVVRRKANDFCSYGERRDNDT